jgi:ATP-binding cassette, subfamily B, bacterial PglK
MNINLIEYTKKIIYLLGDERRKLPKLLLLFFGASMLDFISIGLIAPYIALVIDPKAFDGNFGNIIDFLELPHDQYSLLILLSIGLFCIFLLKAMVSILISYKIISFSQNQQALLRTRLMHSYQSLAYTEYLRRNSSEYIDIIQRQAGQFAQGVLMTSLRTVVDSFVMVAILIALALNNIMALILLLVLFGSFTVGYDRFFRHRLKEYGRQTNHAAFDVVRGIQEGVGGFKEIRILGSEDYFHKKIRVGTKKYANSQVRSLFLSSVPRYLLELLLITFIVLLVLWFLFLDYSIKGLLPTLGMFGVAAIRLIPAFTSLSTTLMKFHFNYDVVARLYDDLNHIINKKQRQILNSTPFIVENFSVLKLDKVTFSYPGMSHNALHNISIEIKSGDSIGIIGVSGSGKTTLIDTLLGLLAPQDGKIFYNNNLLADSLKEWRSQVAYLPQQVFLIDNTLRHNVALGLEDNEIDDDALKKALNKAQLNGLIDQLEQGVNTMIGENGVRLSGGQRQRIALARAFYHNRNVLVLDEATSALDNETESEIVEEIRRLKGKVTMIVIAHRHSTIEHCDRIFRLEEGGIVKSD